MNVVETTGTTIEAGPEVSPIPPCFYLSILIPTFAVVVMGLQMLVKPRARPVPPSWEEPPES